MTHEPDIIREAERYMWEEINDRGEREWVSYPKHEGPLAGFWGTPLHGLDNPEPTVRVAADEQRDYGDEHKERE